MHFFFNATATTQIYPLSLHDALPIFAPARAWVHDEERLARRRRVGGRQHPLRAVRAQRRMGGGDPDGEQPRCQHGHPEQDRKSTRLNSSHSQISYAVFCLKKKKTLAR